MIEEPKSKKKIRSRIKKASKKKTEPQESKASSDITQSNKNIKNKNEKKIREISNSIRKTSDIIIIKNKLNLNLKIMKNKKESKI